MFRMPCGIRMRAMIPPDTEHMYLDRLRSTRRRTVCVIAGVALTNAVVVSSFLGWRMFPRQVGYQVIVAACVGMLFWLSGPFITSYGDRLGPAPRWVFRVASWAILFN